jgi:H+/Cl- antiporter ClcA
MTENTKKHLSPTAWLIIICAAILVGVVAFYFTYIGKQANLTHDYLIYKLSWLAYLLPAVGLTLITLLRVKLFNGTEGTGIPQTIASLEMEGDEDRKQVLSIKILVGKILLTTLGLFSGASMGREGPTVQAGACVMYLSRKFVSLPQHIIQRGLILAGGAAGIAAAFNAPIAGIVFSFEEISRSFDKRNLGIIMAVVLVACVVCVWLLGDYWFYGQVQAVSDVWQSWVFVPVIAVCMGLCGGYFSHIVVCVYPKVLKTMSRRPILVPMVLGLLIGFIGWLSSGLTLGTGYAEAQNMLIHGSEMQWYYAPLRMLATALTLLSGIPGGLFDPSLSAGAGFGQLFADLIHTFDWASEVDTNLIMLIAMACFFAAVVQSPVTAVVIMVEMTDTLHATLPMLLGAIIAYMISKRICTCSIYVALANNYFKDNCVNSQPRDA